MVIYKSKDKESIVLSLAAYANIDILYFTEKIFFYFFKYSN